jgi:GNAT superfamily N-acetyltransferase
MHHDSSQPTARFAVPDDASEVVRLACVMFTAMGEPEPDDEWKTIATAQYARRVGDNVIGAVFEHPTEAGKLIASAAAVTSTNLPTLINVTGAQAYIQWVATDEAFRRRGCARAVMTKLLEQLDTLGGEVALHATRMGEPLYRSLGFWEGSKAPALRRRIWDPAPGTS